MTRAVLYQQTLKAWQDAGCSCIPTIVIAEVKAAEGYALKITTTHEPVCALRLAGL